MMLGPCYTFGVLLLVASSYGALYLSVTRGEGPNGFQEKRSFRIPDRQGTGWLTVNELGCGRVRGYAPILLTVQLVDDTYPEIVIADDLLSAKIIRGQNNGSVLVNVEIYCDYIGGGTPSAGQLRQTALVDLKSIALEE